MGSKPLKVCYGTMALWAATYCSVPVPGIADVPTAVMGAQPSGTIYIAALEILRAVGAVEWPSSSATSQTSAYRHSKLCQSLGENKKNKV